VKAYGVVVEKNEESGRTFHKKSCDLLVSRCIFLIKSESVSTEILVSRCIFLIKSESVSADLFPIGLYKTKKQFNKKPKLWKQNGRCLDDVTTAL